MDADGNLLDNEAFNESFRRFVEGPLTQQISL